MSIRRCISATDVPKIKVTTDHGALLRSITEVDFHLKETIELFSDCLEEMEQTNVEQVEETEEAEMIYECDLEYWQQIKELLVEIATLRCEVDTIFCHCTQQNCPFRKFYRDPIQGSASSSPTTSPVLQHQPTRPKSNISYGGFEPMMQTNDVEYDDNKVVEVENKKGPLIVRDKRREPVRRKKNATLTPMTGFPGNMNFRDRSRTLPDIHRPSLAV